MSYELNAIDRASRALPPREVKRAERAEPAQRTEPYRIPASPPAEVLHELDAAARVVEELASRDIALSFSVDEDKKVRIEVKDSGTGQTIRTIPATSLLDALHSGGSRGLMVNELG